MKKYIIKLSILVCVLIILIVAFAVGMVIVPEFTEKKKIDEVDKYAYSVSDMNISDEAVIVGIGEATHGNKEFQMIKLEVLKQMVETGKCASIAFEMSSADGSNLNDCVHDKNIDVEKCVKENSYTLYCTDEMVNLVSFIQDYNANVEEGKDINIYGIDMQNAGYDAIYVAKYVINNLNEEFTDDEIDRLNKVLYENRGLLSDDITLFEDVYNLLSKKYEENKNRELFEALYNVKVVNEMFRDHPYMEDDPNGYSDYRDECMLENLEYVLSYENERGFEKIVLTAHNGHVMKGDSLSYGSITFGQRITEKYGDKYFVIGTDFYYANVNIHTRGGDVDDRENHKFCSANPLAAQAERMSDGMYYLRFDEVTNEDEILYNKLHGITNIGMVGEAYTIWFYLTINYRYEVVQADCFDAMVYVYNANPSF